MGGESSKEKAEREQKYKIEDEKLERDKEERESKREERKLKYAIEHDKLAREKEERKRKNAIEDGKREREKEERERENEERKRKNSIEVGKREREDDQRRHNNAKEMMELEKKKFKLQLQKVDKDNRTKVEIVREIGNLYEQHMAHFVQGGFPIKDAVESFKYMLDKLLKNFDIKIEEVTGLKSSSHDLELQDDTDSNDHPGFKHM